MDAGALARVKLRDTAAQLAALEAVHDETYKASLRALRCECAAGRRRHTTPPLLPPGGGGGGGRVRVV